MTSQSSPIKIQEAKPVDADSIRELLLSLQVECFSIDVQLGLKHMADSPGINLIARQDGFCVGVLCGRLLYHLFQRPKCQIDTVYLAEHVSGPALFEQFLERIESYCQEKGLPILELLVEDSAGSLLKQVLHEQGFDPQPGRVGFTKEVELLGPDQD